MTSTRTRLWPSVNLGWVASGVQRGAKSGPSMGTDRTSYRRSSACKGDIIGKTMHSIGVLDERPTPVLFT
jgi:hypothetical protein